MKVSECRMVPGLLAALATTLVVACGSPESRQADHMKRGEQYFAAGNFDKARIEFSNALQISPNNAEARYMSGRAVERLGNLREAVGHYQAAIDADPKHVKARANLGRVFVFAGAPERAIELIEPAFAVAAEDPDLLTVRGAANIQLKRRDAAFADAEKAVQIAPDNENAVALLASLHRQSGDRDKAADLLQRALQKLPESVDLRQILASLYVEVGAPEKAEAELRKLVAVQPQQHAPRYQLALFLARAKRLDDAEKVLLQSIQDLPDSRDAKLAYVDFLSNQRAAKDGQEKLRQFVTENPKDLDLRLALGALHERQGDGSGAVAVYQALIDNDAKSPKAAAARTRIASLRLTEGKVDEAATLVAATLKENPRNAEALFVRANIAIQKSDSTTAIADLRSVLRDQPNDVAALRLLARAHVANGELPLAEEALRSAMDNSPADVQTRIELAQFQLQNGRAEQAVALLEDSVRTTPGSLLAREALVRAYITSNDLKAAQSATQDLLTLDPKSASGHYLAGLIAQAGKRDVDAEASYREALRLQPQAMDVHAALARLMVMQKRVEAAIDHVAKLVEQDSRNGVARNLLGELHLANKSYQQAGENFAAASKLAPNWWLPYRNLALTRASAGDNKGMEEALTTGVKATNQNAALVADLAAWFERNGQVDLAIAQYDGLYTRNSKLPMAANNLAMLLVTYRQDKTSLDRARAVTASFEQSGDPKLLDTRGWVLHKSGQSAEALPLLIKAADKAPESKVIRYHLAMAQLAAGRKKEARSNLELAVADTGNFAGLEEARLTLAKLRESVG